LGLNHLRFFARNERLGVLRPGVDEMGGSIHDMAIGRPNCLT
jgi:hypothetical protein